MLGQVKTRLAKSMGQQRALNIYRQLLQATLALTVTAEQQLGWRVTWHVTGNGAADWIQGFVPSRHNWQIQAGGNLGKRMQAAFAAELPAAEKVLMIGVDCPQLTLAYLQNAAAALERVDAVFGPAVDGGYVLIGLKKIFVQLFNGPRWSSKYTLRDSLAIAQKNQIVYELAPTLRDLDTVRDLAVLPSLTKD